MNRIKVRELMTPLTEYATVSAEATLSEAVLALEQAQAKVDQDREKHKAVLVFDADDHIIGKLSQWDIIKGLEPNYKKIGEFHESSRYGFTTDFIRSMLTNYDLWRKPLEDICKKAAAVTVREIMSTPGPGEYVEADATLNEAIHQLVVGQHASLLVTEGSKIVGILRLSDVFKEVCDRIKACKMA